MASAVKDRIHFIGFIPEDQLRAAYVYADVAAFPSRYGFGLPTLESMACGTSTVSSRALDAPEFVDDAGLMADPDDSNELASQIIRLLSDDDFRQEIEKKGLKKSSQYSWDRTAQMTAEVYRTIGE